MGTLPHIAPDTQPDPWIFFDARLLYHPVYAGGRNGAAYLTDELNWSPGKHQKKYYLFPGTEHPDTRKDFLRICSLLQGNFMKSRDHFLSHKNDRPSLGVTY